MKNKMLTFFVTLAMTQVAFAQTVNDVPIKDIDVDYIQIIGTGRSLSTKVNVEIDFGQETKSISFKNGTNIKDDRGRNMKFNSMMDALNFMSANGFSFQFAYTMNDEKDKAIYYILKKNK
ncbi:hypothetical protein MKJ01_05805 [Chryseobacterium sp. SSA4.19]|uniref:hypothetical protein n=1 Tax=Chryseobacterium sp. SSA4.19 TaxID=2919915 RepID=UPI001F4D77C6|nr:hypothetical protein [Chryseobacterium sp. SSA4.19]MCJ8153275.1 hypothetical protein [Chryseobacterium sp. SSA4.19]